MPPLMHDPIGLTESAVIVGCLVFYAWWWSPRQRRKRLREQARARMQWRRAFHEPLDRADVRAPALSVPEDRDPS
jgi:hypothetical protein